MLSTTNSSLALPTYRLKGAIILLHRFAWSWRNCGMCQNIQNFPRFVTWISQSQMRPFKRVILRYSSSRRPLNCNSLIMPIFKEFLSFAFSRVRENVRSIKWNIKSQKWSESSQVKSVEKWEVKFLWSNTSRVVQPFHFVTIISSLVQ